MRERKGPQIVDVVDPPGSEVLHIAGIPVGITQEHNQSFYFWQQWGMRGAHGLRVDGHPDMAAEAPVRDPLPADYWKNLHIGNFTCPAFFTGMLTSLYWYNPLAQYEVLRDMGAIDGAGGRHKLTIKTNQWGHGNRYSTMRWDNDFVDSQHMRTGVPILWDQLHIDEPFLLDVDLDGFSCLDTQPAGVDGQDCSLTPEWEDGYTWRIASTKNLLSRLPRPRWITITRSQDGSSEGSKRTYVPPRLVDEVQVDFIQALRDLYAPVHHLSPFDSI